MNKSKTFDEDGGTTFGSWGDKVSSLIYRDVMPIVLGATRLGNTSGTVGDYGGANGHLRQWMPEGVEVITIDIDPSKQPDVLANVIDYQPPSRFDLTFMRYLIHYLEDGQVVDMLDNLRAFSSKLVLVQICNDARQAEIKSSICGAHEEVKFWRDIHEIVELFGRAGWRMSPDCVTINYTVTPEFYLNRLGVDTPRSHGESILVADFSATPDLHTCAHYLALQ
jgi:hypothetical protein